MIATYEIAMSSELSGTTRRRKGMKTSKTSEVLRHLKEHDGITSNEAWELYGATRLSAIVFELRKHGHDISTETMECVDRYGRNVKYAKYVLHEGQS
jgi:hypothetical protein